MLPSWVTAAASILYPAAGMFENRIALLHIDIRLDSGGTGREQVSLSEFQKNYFTAILSSLVSLAFGRVVFSILSIKLSKLST